MERYMEKNLNDVIEEGKSTGMIPRMVEEGVSPKHYSRWKFEPITFIMANKLPYVIGNVIKYVMRYDSKDGLKDLKKARRYIDMLIEQEYGKENV
jgi:hypothetical protein